MFEFEKLILRDDILSNGYIICIFSSRLPFPLLGYNNLSACLTNILVYLFQQSYFLLATSPDLISYVNKPLSGSN